MSRHRCWGSSSVGYWSFDHNGVQGRLQQLASCTFAPATTMLKGPPSPSTRRLRLVPALPRSVGLGPIRSPQNVPCPCSVCRLPFPVHAIQLFAPLHQGSPHSVQDARPYPPLKGAMNGAVVHKLFRQSVPLAPAAQPEDDAFSGICRVYSRLLAPGFGRGLPTTLIRLDPGPDDRPDHRWTADGHLDRLLFPPCGPTPMSRFEKP